MTRSPRPRARLWFHAIALVIGGGVLALLIYTLGRDGFERVILGTGWWFAVLAAIDLASVFCDAAGSYCFIRPFCRVRYLRVFAAQASGLAINRLTPGNSLGEPVKVTMLMAHAPQAAAVSAIVMFNLGTYIVAVITIAIGVPLTLLLLDLPPRAELAVSIAMIVMVVGVTSLIVLARRGALSMLLHAARKVRLLSEARAARLEIRLAEIDGNLRNFGRPGYRIGIVFVVLSRLLNMTGGLAIIVATGTPLTGALVVGALSVGILITWISNIIPLGLGIADGGNYALYGALGSTPGAGLEFAMINRVRTVVLASMGLAVMAISNLFSEARRSGVKHEGVEGASPVDGREPP